ncbi:unnamed protein product [Acanthoscelides obtectus]|uniref:Uncharacterized protein n=1 Tax=Acanthoscelides obtectus TaxID=200917 RepID=A0A9P0LJG7_ACAOB|nr:unnamed protein product [Acanthoscelides obtectus]CAK1630155.1 hypothetical protein AOBTE_LOCUS6181 [Acanthoscelides obtectus]
METLVAPQTAPDGMGMDAEEDEDKRRRDRAEVRDFIERLVNVLLGENVDDASVNKLYNDEKYLPVAGQSPCSAHATLKQIIERLLREALNLPNLNRDTQSLPPNETDRTYEDLLATAIINKVVSNGQHTRPGSSAASLSSRTSTPRRRRVKEYFFGEETLEDKWKTTDLDTSSVSSLEEWIHSDSSFGSKKYVDRVTLTIKQDIEEVAHSESDDEDDSEYFRTNSSLLSEEEPNWFLQKRQFQGTHSPVPVPMLVPNPTTEAKVLIGDKEIDETSDLSDAGSDYGEAESVPGRTSLLIESKTVIGGKNVLVNGDSDEESSGDSGVKEVDGSASGTHTPNRHIARADITVDDDNVEDASIMSVYSNTEKVAEYTEKYGSLPRTIMKSPVPTPPARASLQKSKQQTNTSQQNGTDQTDNMKENGAQDPGDDSKEDFVVFSGSYSRREKEKWKHAIEMKNNPYSPENIEKRMKHSSSTISSLFGPDYYAKLAATPSGGRVDSPEVSLSKRINQLEEASIYSSLPRSLYTSKNSSKNFVKNPLLNFPENQKSL